MEKLKSAIVLFDANGRAKVRFITHGVFCCLVIVVYVYQVHVSCFGLKTCVGIVRNVCC